MQLTVRRAILLYTIVPVVIIFAISAASGVSFLRSRIQSQVNEQMTQVAVGYADGLDYILRRLAGETNRTAVALQAIPELSEDELYNLLRLHVGDNPVIYGAAIAFKPYGYSKDRKLFAPYVFNSGNGLKQIDIGTDGYDYTDGSWEWWSVPGKTKKAIWTEPYFDKGAGNILMTTFSTPFFSKDGEFQGVVTLDIGLDALKDRRFRIKHSQFVLVSKQKKFLYHFKPEWIGRTVDELVEHTTGIAGLDTSGIATQTLSGEAGSVHIPIKFDGDTTWLFYAPVKSTGWTLGLLMYDSNTFAVVEHNLWRSILFLCLFLLFLSIAVFKLSKRFSGPMEALVEQCRRMERLNFQATEKVSSDILEIKHLATTLDRMRQALFSISSMREDILVAESIRKRIIPASIPQLPHFEIQACSETSADIGGEAYDVVEYRNPAGNAAYRTDTDPADGVALILSDVAGFGLDAAITGAQLRTIFRTAVRLGIDLQTMAQQMNRYLCSDVAGNGLAEVWCGEIDRETYRLRYLSFGQIPTLHFIAANNSFRHLQGYPIQLGSRVNTTIPKAETIQLAAGDIVIVASDGVLNALNPEHVPFGPEGIQRVTEKMPGADARDIVIAITEELASFTSSGDTASDLTMLVIKCTG